MNQGNEQTNLVTTAKSVVPIVSGTFFSFLKANDEAITLLSHFLSLLSIAGGILYFLFNIWKTSSKRKKSK